MKSLVKYHIALVAFALLSLQAIAQQYPVQANLSVSPPYPNKVSSLFPLSGSKLQLSVMLTDVAQPEVQVRVRVKIEGAGLTVQSKDNPTMPTFTIMGGVPQVLSQQLEPYFRTQNLMASGNGASQFMQNGTLPEGFFTISITVIEHWRNVQISNTANAYAWIMVNDPPQLVTPANNQTIEPGGMQNVFISWIPRHVATPTSGGQISYNLAIWEVPEGFDPQMAINSLQPIETVNTLATSYLWGPANTPLTPGKRYVVAVKAVDSGNEVVFQNNGLSVPHSFVYGQPCLTPINLQHSNVFIETADVEWFPLGTAQNFRVELKTSAEGNDAWRAVDVTSSSTTLNSLLANTTYSYRVSAVCGSFTSNPTPERSFKTQAVPELNNECSSDVGSFSTDGSPLLSDLQSGMVFMASGFPVEVYTYTSAEPNTFNGDGMIFLPLFNFGLKAKLNSIKVNQTLQLVDGTVEAVVSDDLTLVGGGWNNNTGPGAVDFTNPNDTVHISSPIDSVYMNPDSTWNVVTDNGEVITITPGEGGGTLVVDPDGNGVIINDGQVYPVSDALDPQTDGSGAGTGGGAGPAITPTSICSQTITFSPGGSLHRYGFDPYREFMPPGTYHTITADGQTLHLPWKSVASIGSDRLYANPATDSTITFAYEGGLPVQANATSDGYNVWATPPPGGEDNLLALCQADSTGNASVAGGVRVKTYDLVRHRVTIVPVGDAQPSFTQQQLQTALNQIYAPAVIEWEVTFDQPIDGSTVPGIENGIAVNNTDYSEAMRSVWRAYVMQRSTVPGTTYLFIIPSFTDNPGMAGYMPLKSNYGFLTPQATTRDAAHELGHGVFNLRHTFSPHNTITLPEGSTQNLMDYPSTSSGQAPSTGSGQAPSTGSGQVHGTELFKYQWDFIHNPEGGWFVFEDSEEGAIWNMHLSKESIHSIINLIRYDNIEKKENSDLSVYTFSKGSASNLELTDDFVLDYIDIEVRSGKKEDQPFTYEELKIDLSELISEISPNPTGQGENFVKLYYNRMDKAAPPRTGLVESTEVGIYFVVKESQRGPFERYLFGESLSDTIKIYITRTHTGNNSTTGTLRTDDRTIYGYSVELPRGSESNNICTDEEPPYDCHCIVEGVFNFVINTNVYNAGNTKNHSLRIVSPVPNGRAGVLVHGGRDDAKGWSQGCILPMPNSPEINSILSSPNRKNTVIQSIDFTKEIIDWVRMRETEIKGRNEDITVVVKQIIITKTF